MYIATDKYAIWPCSEIAMLQALHHLFRIFPSLVILQAFTCLALLALDRVRYRGHQSLSRAETGTCLLCPRPRFAASLATARTCASSPHSATRPVLFRSDSACSCWRPATAGASRHLALSLSLLLLSLLFFRATWRAPRPCRWRWRPPPSRTQTLSPWSPGIWR